MSDFDIKAVVKTGLRSAAVSVPVFAPWVQAWNEHEAVELQRRLDRYWNAFVLEAKASSKRLEEVELKLDDIQRIFALTERTIGYARSEPDQSRQERFATTAVNAIKALNSVSYDTKVSVIDTLNTLTETDLNILRLFNTGRTLRVEGMPGGSGFGEKSLSSLSDLIASLAKLEARGLISQTSPKSTIDVNSSVGDSSHWTNQWRNRDYEILPFGLTFLSLTERSTYLA